MVVTTKQRDVFNNLLNIDVYIGADRLDQSNCIDYLGVKLNLSRVQRLQNRAARIITGNFDYINVRGIDIVKRLKWMNVIERRDYLVALIVFKCIRGMAPTYISDSSCIKCMIVTMYIHFRTWFYTVIIMSRVYVSFTDILCTLSLIVYVHWHVICQV